MKTIGVRFGGLLPVVVLITACARPGLAHPEPRLSREPPASLIAEAEARDWTLRVRTVSGDTLAGRVTVPAPGLIRIRTKELSVGEVLSIERRLGSENGLTEAKAMAGAAVGGMVGMILGWVFHYPTDTPCDGCNTKWFAGGAIAGLILGVRAGRPDVDVRWETLWRRP